MEPRLYQKSYVFDLESEQMLALMKAEDHFCVRSIHDKLSQLDGVRWVEYNGLLGARIMVGFQCEEDGTVENLETAGKLIKDHLEVCERFVIYVGETYDDCHGKTLIHAGDGFVLCNVAGQGGKDLGVSLHFLHDGERSVKWFTDGAAAQFRELAVANDSGRIRKIVAKHIELDPATPKPMGR